MLKVSPLFTDGAVLCRRKEIRVFGEAEEGRMVSGELRDDLDRVLAGAEAPVTEGRFLLLFPPQEAACGCRLILNCGEERFEARDLCIGEVYLAGGQSNMELELQNADEGRELMRTHSAPLVRYFNVPRRAYLCDEAEEAFASSRWHAVSPGQAGDMSAVAYFFAVKLQRKLEVPVGIVDCYWGGTSVTAWMTPEWLRRTSEGSRYLEKYEKEAGDKTLEQFLAEEKAWQDVLHAWEKKVAEYKEDHPKASGAEINREVGNCPWYPPAGPGSPYRPGALWDTMMKRVIPLALSGMLWYQGESDAGLTKQYDVLLMSLADQWRTAFLDDGIPFLNIQLPMWIASDAPGDTFTWPEIRLAQARVRDMLANSGMICLLDQGEWDNLHPTNKRVVGERLCELAQRMVYGLAGEVSPRAAGKYTEGNTLTVVCSAEITVSDGEEPALLEAAGADGHFEPARADVAGKYLRLQSEKVSHPVAARYAWTDYAKVNLFGKNGLPLEPFLMR